MKIVVESFKELSKGKLKGFCDLLLPEIGLRLIDCCAWEDGSITPPAVKYAGTFKQLIRFADEEGFRESSTKALQEFRYLNPHIQESWPC